MAINDINPQAPTHVLIIPREPLTQLSKAEANNSTQDGGSVRSNIAFG